MLITLHLCLPKLQKCVVYESELIFQTFWNRAWPSTLYSLELEIFNEISFDSIEDYFQYLLDKPIIMKVNKVNGINYKKVLKESNKQLIKK